MPRRPAAPEPLPEHVVTDPAGLAECLDHLAAQPVIAFDTEFVGEDTYRPDLCLVQVATAERLYLLDPLSAGPLDDFWKLLLDPARTVVVHAGREEIRVCQFQAGSPPAALFDVQVAAALVGYQYPIGYAGLVQEVLRVRASKGETLTDWRRRPLSASQMRYAFDDVRFLLPIWRRLADRLAKLNREAWAAEEFAALTRHALGDDPTVERWRRVKGIGTLDRKGLAVARELFAWREGYADRVNRPTRAVLRDDLIVEIARRAPGKPDDLHALRGFPKGEGAAILDAVRRARALAPADYPAAAERDNDPPHVGLLANILNVVMSAFSYRHHLAPNFVATASELKMLARSRQPGGSLPADFDLAAGWRGEFVFPELVAFLDGRSGLRVVDPADPHPLDISRIDGCE